MNENDKAKGAALVESLKAAGVVVIGEDKLVELLAAKGGSVEVLQTILATGVHDIRFSQVETVVNNNKLNDALASEMSQADAAETTRLLKAYFSKKLPNQNFEGWRQVVRHWYFWLVVFCAAVVGFVLTVHTLKAAAVVALAFYPPLTAAWFYSTRDTVHGSTFRAMTRTAQINTIFRVSGLFMSFGASIFTIPTLF